MSGKLITFEGGEGSGKGTMVEKLAAYLTSEGYSVDTGREPGSVDISEEIREIIQKPRDGKDVVAPAELFLYEAARAQFTEEFLKPGLERNDFVILDRFYDSTTAYQGFGRGLDLELIHDLNKSASHGLVPDLTFILDVSPETGLRRCEKYEFGDGGDRLEQAPIGFHNRVREGYLQMAENDSRFIVIDAENQGIERVFETVKKEINSLLY